MVVGFVFEFLCYYGYVFFTEFLVLFFVLILIWRWVFYFCFFVRFLVVLFYVCVIIRTFLSVAEFVDAGRFVVSFTLVRLFLCEIFRFERKVKMRGFVIGVFFEN